MVMITALAITRERERGTMENLLSMPTRPFEVMIGKIIPYILVGYIQITLILLALQRQQRLVVSLDPLLFFLGDIDRDLNLPTKTKLDLAVSVHTSCRFELDVVDYVVAERVARHELARGCGVLSSDDEQ